MTQSVTLSLPEGLFDDVQRIAEASNQPLEEVLLTALRASLPDISDLPEAVVEDLLLLEKLSDTALKQVMLETVDAGDQSDLATFLEKNQEGTLTESEQERLRMLQREADKVMFRKARAVVLLLFGVSACLRWQNYKSRRPRLRDENLYS